MATGRESDKFIVRLPDGMRDRIKAVADANGRSMNAEIVSALEDKFPEPKLFDALIEALLIVDGARHSSSPADSRLGDDYGLQKICADLKRQLQAIDPDKARTTFRRLGLD